MQPSDTPLSSINTVKANLLKIFSIKIFFPVKDTLQNNISVSTKPDWFEQIHGNAENVATNQKETD